MTAAVALPPLVVLFGGSWPAVAFAAAAALAIIALHRSNIERLVRGSENRFALRLPRALRRARAAVLAAAGTHQTPPRV